MVLDKATRAEIEEVYGPIRTWDAAIALSFIQDRVEAGEVPVMAGTEFYRHGFVGSQFGSYIYYLDQRGTKGACQANNVFRTFDFIPARPVEPALVIPEPVRGGMVVAIEPAAAPAPTLLEAAAGALLSLRAAGIAGKVVTDLEQAILAERTH